MLRLFLAFQFVIRSFSVLMRNMFSKIRFLVPFIALIACGEKKSGQIDEENIALAPGTFAYDVAFVKSYKEILVLGTKRSPAKVLIVGDYQGRVMTSTANGDEGNSYGWINYDLIRSGDVKPHMNPYGGEDRFWLGPEGGQYGLFFKKGDPFDFDHWQTPAMLDTESFDLVSADTAQATFKRSGVVTNFLGTSFHLDIRRQIQLLEPIDIENEFGFSLNDLKAVSYQSINSVTNTGDDWNKKNGLLSIWILGMFNPSKETVIILPHEKSTNATTVTDNYFGTIPSDRIIKADNLLALKGDGTFRGKVGIAPSIAKNVVGSYDPEKHILTIVKFDLDKTGLYVNSKWETQKEPFMGDAVNSYNDGPQADGSQLGPFYELESSSPVRELKKGETLIHRHVTLHVEGTEEQLNQLAKKSLGVELGSILEAFVVK